MCNCDFDNVVSSRWLVVYTMRRAANRIISRIIPFVTDAARTKNGATEST